MGSNQDLETEVCEKLRQIAESRNPEEIDSALSSMLKDFETDLKILQVIGHLIQWTSDLILHEVTSVRKAPMDLEDISTARQLLLIIRLWSFLLSACTPQFTVKDGKTDIISEAFKLLTEVWLRIK